MGEAYNAAVEMILGHEQLSKFKYLLTLEEDNMPLLTACLSCTSRLTGMRRWVGCTGRRAKADSLCSTEIRRRS